MDFGEVGCVDVTWTKMAQFLWNSELI